MGAIAGRPRGDAVGGSGAEGLHPVGPSGPVMGMDLGGTYLRAALTDEYGRIVLKRRVETLAHEGREAVLERIVALLNEVKGQAGGRGVGRRRGRSRSPGPRGRDHQGRLDAAWLGGRPLGGRHRGAGRGRGHPGQRRQCCGPGGARLRVGQGCGAPGLPDD